MTYKELIEGIFDVELRCDTFLCDIIKGSAYCKDNSCAVCALSKKWMDSEVDLGKIYANISVMGLGKALLNSMYGAIVTYKDTDTFPMNKPIDDEWTEVPASLIADEVHSIAEILDDATVHGLDFKYENGKYYYKERTCP